MSTIRKLYTLQVFVPESHLEAVKKALFQKGAGKIGNYDSCCWQVKGMGQFRPIDGAKPYIGQQGIIEQVEEYRVEMMIEEPNVVECIKAMKEAHPYETPAYYLLEHVQF